VDGRLIFFFALSPVSFIGFPLFPHVALIWLKRDNVKTQIGRRNRTTNTA